MKKIFLMLVGIFILAVFVGTAVFLYQKSQEPPVVYESVGLARQDIINKTVATGRIVPRKEVAIKSQVSGVVHTLYAEAGESIEKGDLIAKIELIPDMEHLSRAESQLETAKINFKNAQQDLVRQRKLYEDQLIPEFEFNKFLLNYDLQKEAVASAENAVALIKEGASKKSGKVSNIVKATVTGMILDVPVKEGTFVIETNTFNDGTTIANIANMDDLIFEGRVDESEVGKLKVGMPLILNVAAIGQKPFEATLEYISPKGVEEQGTIKFEIRAAVRLQTDFFLRAGYSANADIVLDRRDNVLVVNEGLLVIEEGKAFVDVEVGEQQFEKREIQTGLSDGIAIEVISGLSENERVKKR